MLINIAILEILSNIGMGASIAFDPKNFLIAFIVTRYTPANNIKF